MNPRAKASDGTSLSTRSTDPAASMTSARGNRRRCFSAEYKLRILEDASAAKERGELAALLRREGLYSSHLTMWRAEAERGRHAALEPKRRGPKPLHRDPRDTRIAELAQANAQLHDALRRAQAAVEAYREILVLTGRDPDAAAKRSD